MAGIFGWMRRGRGNASAVHSPRRSGKSSALGLTSPKDQTGPPDCTCSHRMTIHYYGGYGVTEHCLVFGCPCVLYERPYVKPPKPPAQVPHGGIGNAKNT